jgi:hypothetical protein
LAASSCRAGSIADASRSAIVTPSDDPPPPPPPHPHHPPTHPPPPPSASASTVRQADCRLAPPVDRPQIRPDEF